MKLLILCLLFGAVLALTNAVPTGEKVNKEITKPESVGEADLSEADPSEEKVNKETDETDPEEETDLSEETDKTDPEEETDLSEENDEAESDDETDLSEETDEADSPDETDLSEEDDSLPDDVKEAEDAENGLRTKRWSSSTCRRQCVGRCRSGCHRSCKRRCRRKWWSWRCRRRCKKRCRRGCSGRCRSHCARLLPNRWYKYNGRYYAYVTAKYHWAQAQRFCTRRGATLAYINNRAVDFFLRRLSHGKIAWIGMFDSSIETWWLWVSGENRVYLHFCRGQPNNLSRAQHCAHINFGGKFCWNDERCSAHLPFICEKK